MAFGHSAEGNEMPRNYWMLVTTPANYVVTWDLSFALLGLPSYLRRKAESMTSGDRLLLYVSGLQRFGATVTLTSTCFEEDTVHWRSHKLEETFPYRVSIEPAVVLDDEVDFLDARQIKTPCHIILCALISSPSFPLWDLAPPPSLWWE